MAFNVKTYAQALQDDYFGTDNNSSTSLANGWAGTVYYERLSNYLTLVAISITTVGTTTNGTTIATLAAGYRPEREIRVLLTDTGGTDGVCGYLTISTSGVVAVYDFNATATVCQSTEAVFMARN